MFDGHLEVEVIGKGGGGNLYRDVRELGGAVVAIQELRDAGTFNFALRSVLSEEVPTLFWRHRWRSRYHGTGRIQAHARDRRASRTSRVVALGRKPPRGDRWWQSESDGARRRLEDEVDFGPRRVRPASAVVRRAIHTRSVPAGVVVLGAEPASIRTALTDEGKAGSFVQREPFTAGYANICYLRVSAPRSTFDDDLADQVLDTIRIHPLPQEKD